MHENLQLSIERNWFGTCYQLSKHFFDNLTTLLYRIFGILHGVVRLLFSDHLDCLDSSFIQFHPLSYASFDYISRHFQICRPLLHQKQTTTKNWVKLEMVRLRTLNT